MHLIAELAVNQQLLPVLTKLKTWNIEINSVEWVEDVKLKPFFVYSDSQRRVILPAEPGTIFVYSYGKHADDTVNFAGAAMIDGKKSTFEDKVSVIYFSNETEEVAELRFVHEYLHAIEVPADDLVKYAPKFIWWLELWYFKFLQNYGKAPEHNPYWQRKFYRWLFNQRVRGLM